MKYLNITILVAIIFAFSANAAEKQKHLFILSGQSNMAGLNPNISFKPTVEATLGKGNVTIVKDAQGGKPIQSWYKKWKAPTGKTKGAVGDLYDRLMVKVNEAMEQQQFDTITFVWMQGENDARRKNGDVYAASLKGVIEQLSEDVGGREINFVIGRLSDFDMANEKWTHWTKIREAQVEVADSSPRGAWVNTDDLNDGINKKGKLIENDLHYSVQGYKEFGKRLAEASLRLIQEHAQ